MRELVRGGSLLVVLSLCVVFVIAQTRPEKVLSIAKPQGLQAGDYSYSGEAMRDGKVLGSDGGRFNVGEYSAEFAEPRMRADVLRELANRTGGKFYTTASAGSLLNDIRAHPRFQAREVEDRTDYEGRNAWYLLALAVLFFSVEWFIRKRVGML